MILGVGLDVVQIHRIAGALERRGDAFIQRLFTLQEQALAPYHAASQAAFWAKRFAAKEACFKALGVGRGFGFSWHDVAIMKKPTGQPLMVVSGRVQAYLETQCASFTIHLSLSDDPPVAQAFVVIDATL